MGETEAWQEGMMYYNDNIHNHTLPDIDDNPYQCGDTAYYDWRDGFQYAEEEF